VSILLARSRETKPSPKKESHKKESKVDELKSKPEIKDVPIRTDSQSSCGCACENSAAKAGRRQQQAPTQKKKKQSIFMDPSQKTMFDFFTKVGS
jgi:hypothetical protein